MTGDIQTLSWLNETKPKIRQNEPNEVLRRCPKIGQNLLIPWAIAQQNWCVAASKLQA